MNARRLNYRPRGLDTGMVAIPKCDQEEVGNVRFGSKADVCVAKPYVRFTPKSGHVQCTGSCLLWANSGHDYISHDVRRRGQQHGLRRPVRVM